MSVIDLRDIYGYDSISLASEALRQTDHQKVFMAQAYYQNCRISFVKYDLIEQMRIQR